MRSGCRREQDSVMRIDEPKDGASRGRRGQSSLIQSVARSVRIMQILLYSGSPTSLTRIAAELRVNKTTVMRLLRTLEAEGLVRKNDMSGSYELAMEFWLALAARNPEALAAARAVQMLLDEAAQATGETVILALADISLRAILPVMWSVRERTVHVDPRHLGPMPMQAFAPGKCYLASLSPDELRHWAEKGLTRATRHTITSFRRLAKELAGVRKAGYATTRQEGILGCSGLAVPIMNDAGQTLGGVQLLALASSLTETNIRRWLPILRDTSARLSPLLRLIPREVTLSEAGGAADVSSPLPEGGGKSA